MRMQSYLKETPQRMKEMIAYASEIFSEVVREDFERILITGSGTSYHAGLQMREMIKHFTRIPVDVFFPFEINSNTFFGTPKRTLCIGISQTGTSLSTYKAMEMAKDAGCIVASMAGKENTLIDELVDFSLTVHCGEENVEPKTKGYYCTKLNLALFSLYLSRERGLLTEPQFLEEIARIEECIEKFDTIYADSKTWIKDNKTMFTETGNMWFIGTRDIYGDILECAIKVVESIRIPAIGYEFEEFLHGIYNAIDEDSTVIIFDTGLEKRIHALVSVLAKWTDAIYIIGKNVPKSPKNMVIDFIEHPFYKTFECILPIQLMCAEIPPLKGINPEVSKDPLFNKKMEIRKVY